MRFKDVQAVLSFLRHAEQLKNTLRSARTSNGRTESTAEHSWRLCLMIMMFADEYEGIDVLKLLKICIIHDLGEVIGGDIAATEQDPSVDKSVQERKDLILLIEPLPNRLQSEILSLWDEYENAESKEAKLAKAFDKIETLLQHTQGVNPDNFDYGFNLSYGKKYTDDNALTALIRQEIDKDTISLGEKNGTV